MSNSVQYPNHISEPIRGEIAGIYLKREFRKYFSTLRGKDIWEKIDKDIDGWNTHPQMHSINGLRDYWDGFNGIAAGFKLKIGFIDYLTAENISWSRKRLLLDENVYSGGPFEWISEELSDGKQSANKLHEFFSDPSNKEAADTWRQKFTEHANQSEERDHFPIIGMEGKKGDKNIATIIDGNRRMLLATLNGKTEIDAYIGHFTSEEQQPKNFWIPTSFLMELIEKAKQIQTEEVYQSTLVLLKAYATLSEVVLKELKDRALSGTHEVTKRLRRDLSID